ncbi:subtilisin-like serine peptidase [Leptomonas pyrrhocoris]|uniref:Subtilisin-like serine peptidase n=1 Tax=Leptomonas pyrrhocoris TaxID=157538 RepID=A0A0N0DZD9_LEPPY|nr:subtilisin-like serine peptidase [Leptomonas pyrrhocoris]KPA85171.1 subtilisin-like serine peptidase [Leptomonas pyrrhocoris]|eukprot:XP_015663610.1 subtilisin-like serine peptidase [Leptomonas pyrrhocoris]
MRFFHLKQKVYTTDTSPAINSEDVGVEGKRYPTHKFGRFISNYPILMLATFLLPLAFFMVGCVLITSDMSYSLDDFQIRSTIPIRSDALKINSVLDDWARILSGTDLLAGSVNLKHDRAIVKDTLELRAVIDLEAVFKAQKQYNYSDDKRAEMSNMLSPSNIAMYRVIEKMITQQEFYEDVCFTNDLRGGVVNNVYPTCVPVSSVTQYVFPVWNGTSWNMDGSGDVYQLDGLPRLFSNPSYGWFFDNNFSTLNPVARQLRSQYTFASTRGENRKLYLDRMQKFLPKATRYLTESVNMYYAKLYLGGGTSQNLLMEIAGRKEGFKVGVAAVICFVFSWWHCRTFVVGLYTVAQTMIVYMATVGLYALIYRTLPLTTYSAIIWVTTFCMHGTLSFYDMFVYSGVMATKGRQNNLSVAQRLCFTIRRVSIGVWIADVLAIVIFAINTTSLFNSVVQFSVFMMIALLWNMYCVVLSTPALVVFHHMYFANKRRNLQKQNDVLNAAMQGCRRPEHMVNLLGVVQENVADGEKPYWIDEDLIKARIGANCGVNKREFHGFKDFIRVETRTGYDKFRAARRDIVGAMHKVQKTKQLVVEGKQSNDVELAAAQLQDFLQVGDANPLADEAGAGGNGPNLYYNPRMVLPSDLIHIPPVYVERSEECWAGLCSALGQPAQSNNGEMVAPRIESLANQGGSDAEAATFAELWREAGTRIGVETTSNNRTASLVPLAVRNIVRAHDPNMVVDTGVRVVPLNLEDDAAAPFGATAAPSSAGPRLTGGPSGFGLAKLRYRWMHRDDVRRSRCCGMFGKVEDEKPDERMQRLLRRKVKRDGYSLFERFLLAYFLPAVYRVRYVLLVLLFAMFIALCVAGSFIKAGGLPNTLIAGQEATAAKFAAMDDTFGQRGDCTFCAPYYRSAQDYRQANATDIAACSPANGAQMNLYVDSCGVCNGTNACVDCAGTVDGGATLDHCGGCSVPGALTPTMCTCSVTRNCSYCDWAVSGLLIPVGETCTTVCPATSRCGAHGTCDQYTAQCQCDPGYSGATCEAQGVDCGSHGTLDAATQRCRCAAGWSGTHCNVSSQCGGRGSLLSAAESPTGAAMCACVGHWRGATCQVCDCMNGGMCNGATGECECVGAFVGPRCETCAGNCTLRGTCPDVTTPDYSLWNVRTCIANACVQHDDATNVNTIPETMCSACERTGTTGTTTACSSAANRDSCLANVDCWWYTGPTGAPYCGLAREKNDTSPLDCTCKYPGVWSGETCGACLAPKGATCQEDGTVLGCNGLVYVSASAAMRTDACGVCGGNGLCRGCDGIPGSGKVYDACGVCGGDGKCTGASTAQPVYVDYLFDLTAVRTIENNENWCKVVATIAATVRASDGTGSQAKSVLEDYLSVSAHYSMDSITSFYRFAVANGRLSEAVFSLNSNGEPVKLLHIRYRVESTIVNSESTSKLIVSYYYWIEKYLIGPFHTFAKTNDVSVSFTSTVFQPAVARVGALQSLWFSVGIGLAVTFVFLLVYYVSVTTAAAATMVAAIVCFGSLTVCMIFSWDVDAVLQVCISCTVPIGVEYVVHFCSGYFDYLQTTTSHLFAKDVTRRAAVQGALLRSASAVCTSAVTVIVISIMFDASELTPLKRCGQISITLHLLILIAGVLFIGAVAAFGPMKAYQHWTLSSLLCVVCAVLAAIAVLIMYGANGVLGPHANKILTH